MRGGVLDVGVVAGRYFVCTGRGVVTLAESKRFHAELDRLAELHPAIDSVFYDGTLVEDFERGLAIHWIRWSATRARPSRRVAIVSNIPSIVAVASTFRVLLPQLRFAVFADRESAMAFLTPSREAGSPRGRSTPTARRVL